MAEFLKNMCYECAAQLPRAFLWMPVFIALGIAIYFIPDHEPHFMIGAAFALFGIVLTYGLRRHEILRLLAAALLLVALGFTAVQYRSYSAGTAIIAKPIGPVIVEGTIRAAEILEGGRGKRLLIGDLVIEDLETKNTPRFIRLTARRDAGFAAGQRVKLLAEISPPSEPVAPGAFNFRRAMFFQGIGGLGFVYKTIKIEQGAENVSVIWIENLRDVIAVRVAKVINPETAPLSIAFITGQRTAISDADNEAMRDSGLSHLISISGLHIGLFSAFVFFAVRMALAAVPFLALHWPIKKIAAVFGFAGAAFYTVLSGADIPAERALLMAGVAYLAILLDRSPFSMRLLAFAASVILLTAPESLLSVSFQMSFAAVAALVFIFEYLRPQWMQWSASGGKYWSGRLGLYLLGSCLTTLAATAATAPFALFHFQKLAVHGLAANLIAVPLTSFIIMPAIVMALILMPMGLETYPLRAVEFGIALVTEIAHQIANWPFAALRVEGWPAVALPLMAAGLVFFMLWEGKLRFAALLPILAGIIVIATHRVPDIYVAPEFALVAYRDDQGMLHISSRRKAKFAGETWARMAGLPDDGATPWPREGRQGDLLCDDAACRLELKGKRIVFLKTPDVLRDECAWRPDLILSFAVIDMVARATCDQPMMIDKRDIIKNGATAFEIYKDQIRMIPALAHQNRPWS